MSIIKERVECGELLDKFMPVEEAVKLISDHDRIGISGFTKTGDPKVFFPALARHFAANAPDNRISLFTGASLAEEVEGQIAPYLEARAPYMSSNASRRRIHAGEMDFTDIHLSDFARNLAYGFYGNPDFAVVEASRVCPDGSVILSGSVGISAEALTCAKKVILEVNTAIPDYTGFHDIALPNVYPDVNWPIPIVNIGDRIGQPYVKLDKSKVVAVIESDKPDYPVAFKPASPAENIIAQNVIEFLQYCNKRFNWGGRLPPMQSGVGNIANAIVGALYDSPFKKIRFWTEVFQDGMIRLSRTRS